MELFIKIKSIIDLDPLIFLYGALNSCFLLEV